MNSTIAELTEEKAKELLDAGVHFGQRQSKRSPKMNDYVYGVARNGLQIINLDVLWKELQLAGQALQKLAKENKNILFVGTNKKAVSPIIEEYAEKFGLNFINSRWLGGTLTNPVTRNRINYLRELEGMETTGLINSLHAKEKSFVSKKLKKLKKNLGGLKKVRGAVHAIVIFDPMHEKNAVLEALKKKNNLDIFVVTDTDCSFSPTEFKHVIPCNVSSLNSLKKVMDVLMEYMEAGKKEGTAMKSAVSSGSSKKAPFKRPQVTIKSGANSGNKKLPFTTQQKPAIEPNNNQSNQDKETK